ncbi:F-box-like domain-containing protein 2 [Elsinoe fawcettii]|nr:F-box-like domain-containing protein 2 [Elsinoe fawcettii]
MQPETSASSQTSTEITRPSPPPISRQHGILDQDSDLPPSPPRSPGEGQSTNSPESGLATPDVPSPLPVHVLPELNARDTPSPSNRNRIAEYESTPLAQVKRRPQGPAFDVVKKSRAPDDRACPIAELPNEVLTHALANLSPTDLSSVSLVSKRFHELVTTQHAWRAAFSRFFPGSEALRSHYLDEDYDDEQETLIAPKREFARLTALASWRSEYILRTRLLRSLGRGKPVQPTGPPSATRSGQSHTASATVMYNSQMFTTVNHLHASFGTGLNKRIPHFVHGADDVGTASSSDPTTGKVQGWGLADPSTFIQFVDRFPGDAQYGLGSGQIVGVPNTMDVSEPYGMVYAEGLPDGMIYFRYIEEMRGRFLAASAGISAPELGIPKVLSTRESQTSVWIAKSSSIPSLTDGMVGILSASSLGVLTAYSLGPLAARDQRHPRGEMTARWVLCPGVPIVAIQVDEDYSFARQGQNRIWAVVLNALGEVFYITKFPKRATVKPANSRFDDEARERQAWLSGRSVCWNLLETTRRTARPDPYRDNVTDGSYSPRSSWTGMCLSPEQIKAESREIEAYLTKKPADIQTSCLGWDMRRMLEIDFAGDDGNNAGESIIVIEPGLDEDSIAAATRYTRVRSQTLPEFDGGSTTPSLTEASTATSTQTSMFGGSNASYDFAGTPASSQTEYDDPATTTVVSEEWRTTILSFGGLKSIQITAAAMDLSTFATTTTQEDPILNFTGASVTSSPSLTPMSATGDSLHPSDIPGQRTRLLALGTSMGTILLYNLRSNIPPTTLPATLSPLRMIHTSSPSISTLALSSLYLVHGGTDGLVQAWDPLASSLTPIRTLHSRFSSRARRRLAQAAASPAGVGINLFAAGAICLDPDPTVLRGVVSLGTHLFYWHFSSSAADAYRSHKRRLRRSERMSNSGGEKFVPTPRQGGTRRFIENEKWELEREEERERREKERVGRRFGTDLLGESATEEEMLAYAKMVSEEAFQVERSGSGSTKAVGGSGKAVGMVEQTAEERELEEAIRRSLAEEEVGGFEVVPESSSATKAFGVEDQGLGIPFRYAKKKRSPKGSPRFGAVAGGSTEREKEELEFALEMSMAEERSRMEAEEGLGEWQDVEQEEFPDLPGNGKGKGKGRAM